MLYNRIKLNEGYFLIIVFLIIFQIRCLNLIYGSLILKLVVIKVPLLIEGNYLIKLKIKKIIN